MNIREQKKRMRKELLAKRNEIPETEREQASKAIFDKILQMNIYKLAETIMVYVSYSTEINTHDFIKRCIEDGKRVVTPICQTNHTMILAESNDFPKGFVKTKMGIAEIPIENAIRVDPRNVDLIITPGISFTLKGDRLGYGGGYYDRLFESIRNDVLKVCPCYEKLLSENLPVGIYDKKVNIIVTERQVAVIGLS